MSELPNAPLSRIEGYLNNIATGEATKPPAPLSRIEQYLDYIAENGGGGSKYDGDVEVIILNPTDYATLGDVRDKVDEVNDARDHVLFDTLEYGQPLYLVTIYIEYDSNNIPVRYKVQDFVTGKVAMGIYDATLDFATILSEAADAFYSLTVSATTKDGVTVTGQTVTIRQGGKTGAVYAIKSYEGQPVTFVLPSGFNYYAEITDTLVGHFSPDTVSGLMTENTLVSIIYNDISHITTFADVADAIASMTLEEAQELVGNVQIADTWKDENGVSYDDPMDLVAVQVVEDATGVQHNAAIMQRHWATKNDIAFDAAEAGVLCDSSTETVAEDGLYYMGKSGDTWTKLNLSVGATIPYSNYDAIYKNGINWDNDMRQYGYGRWGHSAYRQYLNSSASIGNWWEAQHIGDTAPSQLATTRGYMAGCSEALKAAAKPIKVSCYLNCVTDGSAIEKTVDTFWLPSGTEMYGSVNANEGTYFPYWKTATGLSSPANDGNAGRIAYSITDHDSKALYELRSAFRDYSGNIWYVTTWGGLYNSGALAAASYSRAALPACAIY